MRLGVGIGCGQPCPEANGVVGSHVSRSFQLFRSFEVGRRWIVVTDQLSAVYPRRLQECAKAANPIPSPVAKIYQLKGPGSSPAAVRE